MTAPRRRPLTPREKAEVLARQHYCCALCGGQLVGVIEWDHARARGLLGSEATSNRQAVHVGCHKLKTRDDRKRIDKAKRCERFMKTGRHRNRKSRPIQSRGFDKSLRKRMDGTVERRRA